MTGRWNCKLGGVWRWGGVVVDRQTSTMRENGKNLGGGGGGGRGAWEDRGVVEENGKDKRWGLGGGYTDGNKNTDMQNCAVGS